MYSIDVSVTCYGLRHSKTCISLAHNGMPLFWVTLGAIKLVYREYTNGVVPDTSGLYLLCCQGLDIIYP